jgi:hypothetical protein
METIFCVHFVIKKSMPKTHSLQDMFQVLLSHKTAQKVIYDLEIEIDKIMH